MAQVQRFVVPIVTAADGSAIAYSRTFTGIVSQIRYVKSDFAVGVDFNITSEATGETIWSEANVDVSATRAPRQPTHGTDGTASLYAALGEPVEAPIALALDRVKIEVTNGGNAKTGTFHIVVV